MSRITAVYHLSCPADEVERAARDIAIEQTVEVPEALVDEAIIGRVATIQPEGDGFLVRMEYLPELADGQLPQLLNLVYGNISMHDFIRLVDLELPDAFLARLHGPTYGVAGLRALLGVYDRPLLCTALKPRGLPVAELADIAREFALGGGDLVKDDHNLVDPTFMERVARCQAAVEEANAKTGRQCLYLPFVCAPADRLERYVEYAVRHGVRGILVPPLIVGLDTVRWLADQYGLLMMSHPTFSGTFLQNPRHGIEPGLLLGTLFRLAGVDVSVFVNAGGRFRYTPEECSSIAARMHEPLGELAPGFPAPAGGMTYERIPDMVQQFGIDSVLLIGGALLTHGGDLRESTAKYLDAVRAHCAERLEPPRLEHPSACAGDGTAAPVRHLPYREWSVREPDPYKVRGKGTSAPLPFHGVARRELLGTPGFDVRYFEIEPGGYTSEEKHVHTHAIIGVRGHGILSLGDERIDVAPNDIAYVPPLAVHQLRNETEDTLFGFYCIVDHERDAPRAP